MCTEHTSTLAMCKKTMQNTNHYLQTLMCLFESLGCLIYYKSKCCAYKVLSLKYRIR